MKPHIILKLRAPLGRLYPHWTDVIEGDARAPQNLIPEVDRIFTQQQVIPSITTEYKPSGNNAWSRDEIQAGFNRIYRIVLLNRTEIPPSVISSIEYLPEVEFVRRSTVSHTRLPEQTHALASETMSLEHSRRAIFLPEAHSITKGSPQIKIAVLDTGIYLKHPELSHCLVPGKDFVDIISGAEEFLEDELNKDNQFGGDFRQIDDDPDDQLVGHGTHVAGIIGAKGLKMPLGVVPDCKIIPVRVLGALKKGKGYVGAGEVNNINNGIKYAVDQGAEIINMSLGIQHTSGGLPHAEVVDYAKRKGVTIVAASGNSGLEEDYYPGVLPHVICVGATDENDQVAHFSTFNKQVSLVAPGSNIYSSFINNDYAFSSGTSHATPFVTGAVAMLKAYSKSKGKSLSDRQVKHILKHTSDKLGTAFKEKKSGYGRLNLIDSLKLLQYKLNN